MGRRLNVSNEDLVRLLASDDPAVRALAEGAKRNRDRCREYHQRPEAKEKHRERMREYFQRPEAKEKRREVYRQRKVAAYARDIAAEKGISFEDAMREIGA